METELDKKEKNLERKLFGKSSDELEQSSLKEQFLRIGLRQGAILLLPIYGDYLMFKKAKIEHYTTQKRDTNISKFIYYAPAFFGFAFKYYAFYELIK